MTPMPRPGPHSYAPATPPAFTPRVRPMREREHNWVIHSWTEGYKGSPNASMPWAEYKAQVVPVLRAALVRHDTRILVATDAQDWAVGWLAFARWPSIDVVHWVYTSHQYRRARSRGLAPTGVMTTLLEAAGLRSHVVYTHKAAAKRKQQRADLRIADLLRSQGTTVSYHPYVEWSR